jgi:hypothetical protein
MAKNLDDYLQLIESVHLKDGTVKQIGLHEGKWLVKSEYEKVAVSKKGFLLHLEYNGIGQGINYKLYLNFTEMATDDSDFILLSKVAAALGVKDYITFLD